MTLRVASHGKTPRGRRYAQLRASMVSARRSLVAQSGACVASEMAEIASQGERALLSDLEPPESYNDRDPERPELLTPRRNFSIVIPCARAPSHRAPLRRRFPRPVLAQDTRVKPISRRRSTLSMMAQTIAPHALQTLGYEHSDADPKSAEVAYNRHDAGVRQSAWARCMICAT